MAGTTLDLDTAADVLAAARASKKVEDAEGARQLELAVVWAAMHSVDSIAEAALCWETGMPVAGEGPRWSRSSRSRSSPPRWACPPASGSGISVRRWRSGIDSRGCGSE